MKNLDLLIPKTPKQTDSFTWATVTAVSPLKVRIDGETTALAATPDSLLQNLTVGTRVWVQRHGKRVLVVGSKDGAGSGGGTPGAPGPAGKAYLGVWSAAHGEYAAGSIVRYAAGYFGTVNANSTEPQTPVIDYGSSFTVVPPNSAPWAFDSLANLQAVAGASVNNQPGTVVVPTNALRFAVASTTSLSSITLTLNFPSGGTIAFDDAIINGGPYGGWPVRFFIDGTMKHELGSDLPWNHRTYDVGPGTHTFEWRYVHTNFAWDPSLQYGLANLRATGSIITSGTWDYLSPLQGPQGVEGPRGLKGDKGDAGSGGGGGSGGLTYPFTRTWTANQTDGIIGWLGTAGAMSPYRNPGATAAAPASGTLSDALVPQYVVPSQSSTIDAPRTADKALDHSLDTNTGCSHTNPDTNAWWMLDFKDRTCAPTTLAIVGRSSGGHHPRNFKLQGSNNATAWTDLLTVTNEGPNDGTWYTHGITGAASYRYLRIYQTGANSTGANYLVLGDVEIWGTVT